MSKKSVLSGFLQFGWFALSAMSIVAIYTGNAEPYVAPSLLPAGGTPDAGPYMFGMIAVVSFGGLIAISVISGNRWAGMEEHTDLSLEGDGLLSSGEYTGEIGGRPVRARTITKKSAKKTEGGSNRTTYTITEADLAEPTTMGIMLGKKGQQTGLTDFGEMSIESTVVDDRFVVAGAETETLARDLLTRDVRDAVLGVENLDTVTIGDATETITQELPDMSDSMVGGVLQGKMEESISKDFGGTPTTVAIQTKGKLGDPAELNQRIEAVATVADAFERITSERR